MQQYVFRKWLHQFEVGTISTLQKTNVDTLARMRCMPDEPLREKTFKCPSTAGCVPNQIGKVIHADDSHVDSGIAHADSV